MSYSYKEGFKNRSPIHYELKIFSNPLCSNKQSQSSKQDDLVWKISSSFSLVEFLGCEINSVI